MAHRAAVRGDHDVEEPRRGEAARLRAVDAVAFSPLEDQVIAIARGDGLGSIEPPGAIERFVRRLFGFTTDHKALADPRLEALRRAVVVARHRHHLPDAQAVELRAAGFGVAEVGAIEARALAG